MEESSFNLISMEKTAVGHDVIFHGKKITGSSSEVGRLKAGRWEVDGEGVTVIEIRDKEKEEGVKVGMGG